MTPELNLSWVCKYLLAVYFKLYLHLGYAHLSSKPVHLIIDNNPDFRRVFYCPRFEFLLWLLPKRQVANL